jgi:hypothetical protein
MMHIFWKNVFLDSRAVFISSSQICSQYFNDAIISPWICILCSISILAHSAASFIASHFSYTAISHFFLQLQLFSFSMSSTLLKKRFHDSIHFPSWLGRLLMLTWPPTGFAFPARIYTAHLSWSAFPPPTNCSSLLCYTFTAQSFKASLSLILYWNNFYYS